MLLNVLICQLKAETNAEAWFNIALRPRKPEGSLGRTAQDGHLDCHSSWTACLSSFSFSRSGGTWCGGFLSVTASHERLSHIKQYWQSMQHYPSLTWGRAEGGTLVHLFFDPTTANTSFHATVTQAVEAINRLAHPFPRCAYVIKGACKK